MSRTLVACECLTALVRPSQAQKYAAQTGARQVETVVVTFAPVVPDAERERYWAEIVKLVTTR